MRRAAIMLALLAASGCAQAPAAPSLTERNRAIVTEFAHLFYDKRDVRGAFEKYVARDYIQHNAGVGDGRDAAIAALAPMFGQAGAQFDVKRILVDGDLAAIHLRGRSSQAEAGATVADFYRLKDGKIVEHWDVLQPIVPSTRNPHPYF